MLISYRLSGQTCIQRFLLFVCFPEHHTKIFFGKKMISFSKIFSGNLAKCLHIINFSYRTYDFFFYCLNCKRKLVLSYTGSHTEPASAYITSLHSHCVNSIRQPYGCPRKPTVSRNKSSIWGSNISLYLIIVLRSKIQLPLCSRSCFDLYLQFFFWKKEFRLIIFEFSIEYLFYLFFQNSSPDYPWKCIFLI